MCLPKPSLCHISSPAIPAFVCSNPLLIREWDASCGFMYPCWLADWHGPTRHSTAVWMKGVIYCFYSFVQFDYNWGLFTSHYQYLIVAFIHSLPFDLSNSIWTRCTRKHMWEFIIGYYKILDVSWMEFINILSKKNMPKHKHTLIVLLIGESGEIKFRKNIFIFDLLFRWRGWARTIYVYTIPW